MVVMDLLLKLLLCNDETEVWSGQEGIGGGFWYIFLDSKSLILIRFHHIYTHNVDGVSEHKSLSVELKDRNSEQGVLYDSIKSISFLKDHRKSIVFWIKRKIEGWDEE